MAVALAVATAFKAAIRRSAVAARRAQADACGKRGQQTVEAMRAALTEGGADDWAHVGVLDAAAQLKSGELSADALVQRLLRLSVTIDRATNCITEFPAPVSERSTPRIHRPLLRSVCIEYLSRAQSQGGAGVRGGECLR